MKELVIYVITEDLPKVTDILHKHNVGGMVFYEINGRGRTKREEVPEMVRFYDRQESYSKICKEDKGRDVRD